MANNENTWMERLSQMAESSSLVDSSLYAKYDVKRGLRDLSGTGVLAGLTQIGEVQAHTLEADESAPREGFREPHRGSPRHHAVRPPGSWCGSPWPLPL